MALHNKKTSTIYVTHSIEFLCWLIIILVGVLISVFFYMRFHKIDNDYNIYMPDVDGLIVGSPVRMMGIEVGHITEIKPTNQEVFIRFLIKDKNLHLPNGTIATVEFTGMAGSKSLELYLPDKSSTSNNEQILTATPPKRLHDALGLLNDMFDKIGSIIFTSSYFTDKVKEIDIQTGTKGDVEEFLKYSDALVNDATNKANDFSKTIDKYSEVLKVEHKR